MRTANSSHLLVQCLNTLSPQFQPNYISLRVNINDENATHTSHPWGESRVRGDVRVHYGH